MIEGPVCYAELGGVLPDRETIVVSRDSSKTFPGASCAATPEAALELARASAMPGPVWVCGGQWLYEAMLPRCERLYLTEIAETYPGDRFFPDWRETHPRLLSARAARDGEVSLVFSVYSRP